MLEEEKKTEKEKGENIWRRKKGFFCIFCVLCRYCIIIYIFCIFCIFFIIRRLLSSPFQKHMTSQVCRLFLYLSLYVYLSLCLSLYWYFLRPCLTQIIFRILLSSPFQRYITPQVPQLLPLFGSVFVLVSVFVFVFFSVFEFSSEFGQLASWAFRKYIQI